MNNPPEKIFIEIWKNPNGRYPTICRFRLPRHVENIGIEYHLAPVWHDVVKDPPKEKGVYDVGWIEEPDMWERGYWNGNQWEGRDWKRPLRRQPTHYLAIPKILNQEKEI